MLQVQYRPRRYSEFGVFAIRRGPSNTERAQQGLRELSEDSESRPALGAVKAHREKQKSKAVLGQEARAISDREDSELRTAEVIQLQEAVLQESALFEDQNRALVLHQQRPAR